MNRKSTKTVVANTELMLNRSQKDGAIWITDGPVKKNPAGVRLHMPTCLSGAGQAGWLDRTGGGILVRGTGGKLRV